MPHMCVVWWTCTHASVQCIGPMSKIKSISYHIEWWSRYTPNPTCTCLYSIDQSFPNCFETVIVSPVIINSDLSVYDRFSDPIRILYQVSLQVPRSWAIRFSISYPVAPHSVIKSSRKPFRGLPLFFFPCTVYDLLSPVLNFIFNRCLVQRTGAASVSWTETLADAHTSLWVRWPSPPAAVVLSYSKRLWAGDQTVSPAHRRVRSSLSSSVNMAPGGRARESVSLISTDSAALNWIIII